MEKWRRREGRLWLVRITAIFLVNVELHNYRYQLPMRLVLELLHIA